MVCPKCGAVIQDSASFCTECGYEIAQSAGTQIPEGKRPSEKGLGTGAVVGIVIGIVALLALILIVSLIIILRAASSETKLIETSGIESTILDAVWEDVSLDKDGGLGNMSWKIPSSWENKLRDKYTGWGDSYQELIYDPADSVEAGFFITREKLPDSLDGLDEDEIFDAIATQFFADGRIISEEKTEVAGQEARLYHASITYDGYEHPFENISYIVVTPDKCCYSFGCSEEEHVGRCLSGFLNDFISTVSYGTWFEKSGLKITPQGDFTFETMANDGNVDTEEIDVPANVTVTQTTDGIEEGYKKVTAFFVYDISEAEDKGGKELASVSVFDRYTGTSFEFGDDYILSQAGQPDLKEGFVRIQNRDDRYDVKADFAVGNGDRENILTATITLTCPVWYDGAVFQMGYSDYELTRLYNDTDFSVTHTIDELPTYDSNGHEYMYFSAGDS
ncbi:MAG: zinc ribbon domain-containing protein [Lachnospiraceae bacterium]|nr:zinc ribbon domain-containing protein [Lachnospiraceae bacterium]